MWTTQSTQSRGLRGAGNAWDLADATLTAMHAVAETYLDAASTTPLHIEVVASPEAGAYDLKLKD